SNGATLVALGSAHAALGRRAAPRRNRAVCRRSTCERSRRGAASRSAALQPPGARSRVAIQRQSIVTPALKVPLTVLIKLTPAAVAPDTTSMRLPWVTGMFNPVVLPVSTVPAATTLAKLGAS